ncbi:MAG: FlgD immunoglobulin-like domain containing protein [Cyclobacteriaceae bacterium]
MHRLLLIFLALIFLFSKKIEKGDTYKMPSLDEKTEIGLEDLNGRLEYERLLTANPKTGLIPSNIRTRELAFSKENDARTEKLRTSALDISSAGPFNVGGRTRAVALDIRNEDVILAGGVSGGIWKSIDGGATWIRKSDPENRNSVTCLAQDTRPGKEDTWYHGTGEIFANSARGGGAAFRGNGIYKSTDNGETWNSLPSTVDSEPSVFNSQFQYIWDIEINDKNLAQDEVLVAAFGGILRSLDGGTTWGVEIGQQLFDLDPNVNLNDVNASFFTSLEKTSDGVFFASLSTQSSPDGDSPDAGIYISPDGDEWTEINPFQEGSQYRRVVMGHAPSDPGRCYVLVDTNPPFLLRYSLNGFNGSAPLGSWSSLADNVPMFGGQLGDFDTQGSFNMLVKVHPEDPDLVFLGGTNLYRSTDGFSSDENTDWVGGYDPEGSLGIYDNHHPDQHDLLFFPSDPNKMLSASDGGLIVSRDVDKDSVTWTSLNNGYLTSQFFTIGLSKEAGDDFMIGGMQDNGTDLTSGSQNWSGITGGDGGYVSTTPGKELVFSSFQRGSILRVTLDQDLKLTSFGRVDPEPLVNKAGSDYLFITPFVLDPSNPNRMFVAGGNFTYVNQNVSQIPGGSLEGTTAGWERVNTSSVKDGVVTSLDISQDGSVLFFGTSDGQLFKVTNANDVLNMESVGITPDSFPEGYISSISINPENPDHFLVIFSNYEIPSIFESTNGGLSFTDVSGSLEQFADGTGNGPSIRWGELIPQNSGSFYIVGTSTGLYSTELTNGASTTWVKEAPTLVGSAVVTMMDYRSADGRLAVATHGNGIFTTTIDDFKSLELSREGQNFDLLPAYPNPLSENTRIQYSIPEDGIVRVSLYTRKGELVRNLLWAPQFAGENSVVWDGKNASGTFLANGIYLYTVEYQGGTKSGRLLLRN